MPSFAVALHKTPRPGAEAAVRYVLYGATASAVTLYGLSLIFGATGSTYIDAIAGAYATGDSSILILGLVLTLAGFFFKLAVFPFHFWAPDVYEGAPHQVVAFVGTLSKLGAVGVIARICTIAFDAQVLQSLQCVHQVTTEDGYILEMHRVYKDQGGPAFFI